MLMNHPDHCNFNLFWHTSLACTDEKDDAYHFLCFVIFAHLNHLFGYRQSQLFIFLLYFCQLQFNRILAQKHSLAYSHIFPDDQKRHFQLNICDAVKNGACPDKSPLCEVSEKSTLVESIIPGSTLKISTSFDKSTQNVILKYGSTTSNRTAIIDLVCDQSAATPSLQVL